MRKTVAVFVVFIFLLTFLIPKFWVREVYINAAFLDLEDFKDIKALSFLKVNAEKDFQDLTLESKAKDKEIEPLEKLLEEQNFGSVFPFNPLKYAIRGSVASGVSPDTIVLLLLLPVVASLIAVGRHFFGIRGFGIFLPAALSVTFVALGPILGISLFMLIVVFSTGTRFLLRKLRFKLQYLPRMALILWTVAVGILGLLFLAPLIDGEFLSHISIFPVLILTLLAEDFTKVQIGKSVRVAASLTLETLFLAVISYFVLASKSIQALALLHPEATLLSTLILDVVVGRYVGLRLVEFWRFRKLISS